MAITPNGMLSLWQGNLYWGAPQTFENCAAMAGTYGGFSVALLGVPSALEIIRNSIEAPVTVSSLVIDGTYKRQTTTINLGGIGIGGRWWHGNTVSDIYEGTVPAWELRKEVGYQCFEMDGVAMVGIHAYYYVSGWFDWTYQYRKLALFDSGHSAPGGSQVSLISRPWRPDLPEVTPTFSFSWS